MRNYRSDIDSRKEEITFWLQAGVPRAEVARRLDCRYLTLKDRIDKWGLSHLKNQSRKGISHPGERKSFFELAKNPLIRGYKLKLKLFEEGLKEKRCESCFLTEWLGKPIPLELDHIDGNHYNHELSNFRILCPNCHALTDNYKVKNSKRYKEKKLLACMPTGEQTDLKSVVDASPSTGSNPVMPTRKVFLCPDCQKEVSNRGSRCKSCAGKLKDNHKIIWPPIEELKAKLFYTPYTTLARELGVSDNAIRKHLKHYNGAAKK